MSMKIVEIPAFIDMHCHLRDPGFEYKEDIFTAAKAAFLGGYGAVVSMPNTKPVSDNAATIEYILNRAAKASCAVYPTAAITIGQKGVELCDFETLSLAGAVAFTDDGRPVEASDVMAEAMKRCAKRDYLIISHCEELPLAVGVMNEGDASRAAGLKGTPNAAEDVMTARDLLLAEMTGCRLHIAHVSTRGALRMIREAKSRGVRVTCETCPHYFTLCDEDVIKIGVNAKMNPPLRSRDDVKAVIEAIIDGTIDCISTDHAPHSAAEKGVGLEKAPNGIIGLQTVFRAAYTFLVRPGFITLERLSELLTFNPAKIARVSVPQRTIKAEIEEPYTFEESEIVSKSHNSPYIGMSFYGRIINTETT